MIEFWKCLLFLALQLTVSSAACPAADSILPCRCTSVGDDVQIWCSYSSLHNVMEAVRNLAVSLETPIDEFILESNNVPSLPGRAFEGLGIRRLMLRDNGLERVVSSWLSTLEPSLMELFIVEPRLRTLPLDAIDNLNRIEAVTLQAGLMKQTPNFSGLRKLRYIQVHSPILGDLLPENFEDLPSLEQLHIIGSPLLTKLEAGLLKNLQKLQHLRVANTSLSWVHSKAFINLNSLREISLVWNQITDAGVIGRACRELPNLQILRLDNNSIDRIMEASFVELPSLRELYLSGNMISEIHGGAFRNIPSLKVLDLSRNLLRRVSSAAFLYPSGSSLEELWLVDNQLHQVNELRALFNSLHRLKFIDMSKNLLEELPFDVLRGHSALERLHLDENRIKRLPKKALSGMVALRELRLRNNSLSDFSDGPTWNLPSLKGLDLAQNNFRRLDSRLMTYLPALRRLDLSENFIDTVLPDTFIGNLDLEVINLSKNFITSFHALTFSHLPRLYELDMSWNRLREVTAGLPRDLEYLRFAQNQIFTLPSPPNNLQLPHLRLLDLSGNALQIIHEGSFKDMPRLQWLYLNDNLIQNLEKGALNGLSRLETLNIRNNRIRDLIGDYTRGLKGLKELNLQGNYLINLATNILPDSPKLESILLGSNKLMSIASGAFSNVRDLQNLNLTHNSLEEIPDTLRGLTRLKTLDLSYNNLKTMHPVIFETLPSLTELHMSHNKLYDLPTHSFKDLPKLEFLDLSNNEIEHISQKAISNLPNLIAIQMGDNRLTKIGEETFLGLPELQSVDLQSNHLQEMSHRAFLEVPHLSVLNMSHNLFPNTDKAGVGELRSLEILDLSGNKISSLEGRSFNGMDWLVELKMDNNLICSIPSTPFTSLNRLRILTLRHNRMTTLPEPAFQPLRDHLAVLDLEGNPLSCSCRLLWLQSWLKDSLQGSKGPRCRDGSWFKDVRLSRTDCAAERVVEADDCTVKESEKIVVENVKESPPYVETIKNPSVSTESPEYVYDEYMEYEEVNSTDIPPSLIPIEVTANEMKSQLITGNTPTIYAAPQPPKLNLTNPGLGYNDIKKPQQQSPSYSGLTFFGIPLPSLGSLWKGRSHEQYGKGRVQPVANPIARNRETNFVTVSPEESSVKVTTPFVTPSTMERGFVPMLPNSAVVSNQNVLTEPVLEQAPVAPQLDIEEKPISAGKVEPIVNEKKEEIHEPELETGRFSDDEGFFEGIQEKRVNGRYMDEDSSIDNDMDNVVDNANSWYYQNYNKTNLQPFVERTSDASKMFLSFFPLNLSVICLLLL